MIEIEVDDKTYTVKYAEDYPDEAGAPYCRVLDDLGQGVVTVWDPAKGRLEFAISHREEQIAKLQEEVNCLKAVDALRNVG